MSSSVSFATSGAIAAMDRSEPEYSNRSPPDWAGQGGTGPFSPSAAKTSCASVGTMLQARTAQRRTKLNAVRVITAACTRRISSPSRARLLQIGIGARPDARAFPRPRGGTPAPRDARAAARRAARSPPPARARARPASPPPGTRPPNACAAKRNDAVDQIAEHIGEVLVHVGREAATVKSVSAVSGALAISHQRQRSAGSSSSAASVKMPRRRLVENLPPS